MPGEQYLWRPVAIGGGGFITGMSIDDSGQTMVARADVYGAYLWQPEANRWRQLVTAQSMPQAEVRQNALADGVYEIVVAPSDPRRIYLAIKGGLYRSADQGKTWQRGRLDGATRLAFDANGEFRLSGPFLAVSPSNPDLVLFGSPENGAWRSIDGGTTWSLVSGLPKGTDLSPKQGLQTAGASFWFERRGSGAGRIFAMSPGNGPYVSTDGGARFAPLPSATPGPRRLKQGSFAADGSFFGVDDETRKIWRYRDHRWQDLSDRPGLSPRAYATIAIDRKSGLVLVTDQGGRSFAGTPDGESWYRVGRDVEVGKGDPPWLHVADSGYVATGAIVADPQVTGRFWIASGVGPMVTNLGKGQRSMTWVTQVRGIEELVANDAIQPPGGSPLFAAWDFGIHVKDDLNAFSTTYGPRERVLIAAQQIDWSPADPRFIVTNASDTRTSCCSEDGDAVLAGYSSDGGRTWTKFPSLPQPPGTRGNDPWRMSMGMIAVSSNSVDNIVWMPTYFRSAYYTLDRGRSWNRVILPGEKLPFTGTHGQWFMQRKVLAADRVRPGTFYLFHSGNSRNPGLRGLWRTTDGGVHWQRVFRGDIAPANSAAAKLRAVPGKAGHLFFTSGVDGAQDTRLRRSIDGGQHWTVLDAVDHVDDIAFGKAAAGSRYPTLLLAGRIGGEYGIWRSTDEARSWQRIGAFPLGSLDQISVIGADPDVFGRVYLGFKGSGWIYGEPAPCGAAAVTPTRECYRVR
ncbi:hypothetical protein C7I55_17590 [Sphingomonas deserti]|uniref:Exo-alpha-sialidase n=1 Tax=Allosphingosinicella deserti TaxID=2116704 RepID=A0A2P7QKW2_9SPHN|nr:hypothetical protein C7I55_17590 [Sphingomonas deserti]